MSYRLAYEQMGIVADIVHHLQSDNEKLRKNCSMAIFQCAANKVTRDMIRESNGLDPLCKLSQSEELRKNKYLLAAVTGAIWKCSMTAENVTRFNQNGLVASLVTLLDEKEDEEVLTNVVGALAECCKNPANRDVLRTNEGLPKLVSCLFEIYFYC